MGAGAADIAEIVSDVRERLPDLAAPPALESPEAARFRLFDSIAAFLKSASAGQPLVLILDDLQWADKLTLLLLAVRGGRAGGGARADRRHVPRCGAVAQAPVGAGVGRADARAGLPPRAAARAWRRGMWARFIELTSGIAPPEALVQAVYSQTEGNPLFVNEVVRLLVQEGELSPERLAGAHELERAHPGGGARGDRPAAGSPVRALQPGADHGGGAGPRVQLRADGEAGGRASSEEQLLEVLEEATAARVIEELPRPAGRYQFTHALIQETLAGELSSARRVRLHARIAQVLEALYGSQADEHAAELAFHFAEAESVLGVEKLVHYSLAAGERALAGYAYEDALAHFQRGLAAKEGQPVDEQTAALLYGLGRAEACSRLARRGGRASEPGV